MPPPFFADPARGTAGRRLGARLIKNTVPLPFERDQPGPELVGSGRLAHRRDRRFPLVPAPIAWRAGRGSKFDATRIGANLGAETVCSPSSRVPRTAADDRLGA